MNSTTEVVIWKQLSNLAAYAKPNEQITNRRCRSLWVDSLFVAPNFLKKRSKMKAEIGKEWESITFKGKLVARSGAKLDSK